MTLRREMGLALAALLAAAAGCAPMATQPGPTAAGAPPSSTAHHPASSTTPTVTSAAPTTTTIDTTTPSPAAQRVLASIPEPLTPAQQALNASQDTSRASGRAVAPAATYDSLQAAPVPAATQPLGAEASTVTMADTSSAPSARSAAGAATTAPTSGAAASGAAAGATAGAASSSAATGAAVGTPAAAATGAAAGSAAASSSSGTASSAAGSEPCWRLQVAAPLESEKEKADSRREAAQSLLMVSFTIVPEKGYLKVRTGDCMSRDAADALKKRALESGFDGAFLVDTNAPPPPPATKHKRVPASKRKQ